MAAGTSLLVIAINSTAAPATRLTTTHLTLDWPLVGLFTGASIAAVVIGGKLAHRTDPRRLNAATPAPASSPTWSEQAGDHAPAAR